MTAESAITELMYAMNSGNTLSWVVKYAKDYAKDGNDPLYPLWIATADSQAMDFMLIAASHGKGREVGIALMRHWTTETKKRRSGTSQCLPPVSVCCADVIRQIVPSPPPLSVLLAAGAAGRL